MEGIVLKRWQELVIAGTLFLLSFPLQTGTALILWAGLGRPLVFRQHRVGRGGVEIVVPKFRTMSDARDAGGALLPDDRRQTGTTRLIRRLRLDELPQLWTILRGRMALVGPRPLLAATVEGFGVAGHMRNSVCPGLTGWAQVSGNTRLSDAEKLALDLWYVAHRSPALDLRILFATIGVAIRGERRDEARLRAAHDWLAATGAA